jgi:hypothetical protein
VAHHRGQHPVAIESQLLQAKRVFLAVAVVVVVVVVVVGLFEAGVASSALDTPRLRLNHLQKRVPAGVGQVVVV